MKTEALKLALKDANRNERHRTVAETKYWCDQYKLLATQAIEALAQPEQEPVAWANLNALCEQINSVNCGTVYRLPSEEEGRQPLYTAPQKQPPVIDKSVARRIASQLGWEPPKTPLTDAEIQDALTGYRLIDAIDIARAIEAAHGIKGEAD